MATHSSVLAWWAAVYGITQNRTQLKQISSSSSSMAQGVKNPPAVQETQEMSVQSLGQKDPLEESMATQSCQGKSSEQRSLVGYRPQKSQDLATK